MGGSELYHLSQACGNGVLFWTRYVKIRIHWETSWLADKLVASASEEGLWFVQWRKNWTSLKGVRWAKNKLSRHSSKNLMVLIRFTTNSEWSKINQTD